MLDSVLLTNQRGEEVVYELMDSKHIDESIKWNFQNIWNEVTREIGQYRKDLVVRFGCLKLRFSEMVQLLVIMPKEKHAKQIKLKGRKGTGGQKVKKRAHSVG